MIPKTLTLVAGGALVALFACGGEDVGPKYPSAESFCSGYAEALCKGLAAGCGASEDSCKLRAESTCKTQGAATSRQYRDTKAEACVDKTNEIFGKKSYSADEEKEQKDLCSRVFGGTVDKNGACQVDAECKDQLICDKGLCSEKVQKNLGEACNNPGDVCAKGAYCGDQGAVKFCIAKKASGDLCTAGAVPCLEDLRCVNTCKPKLQPGEPCDTDDDCPSTTTPGYCDPLQKKCVPKYGLGTASCKDIGGA